MSAQCHVPACLRELQKRKPFSVQVTQQLDLTPGFLEKFSPPFALLSTYVKHGNKAISRKWQVGGVSQDLRRGGEGGTSWQVSLYSIRAMSACSLSAVMKGRDDLLPVI